MKFGPVPLSEAKGAILAHSVGVDGGRLRKGARLGDAEIAALRAAGLESVIAARLGPEDVSEDEAAAALARAVVPDPGSGLDIGAAATGRVNLRASGAGVLQVDAGAIDRANGIDPMITIATLPEWSRVEPGQMVATVKIISYGVAGPALGAACAAAAGALRLRGPVLRRAALIETEVGKPVADKGRRALETRLERLGVTLDSHVIVPHRAAEVTGALAGTGAELICILTGSATSDPGDVAPAALRAAGGTVAHFGMPVDPGNLLFIGALGGRPVIGLPGCARSPALNGADWVLERVICGVPVGRGDIMGMGVGGLLKEIPSRPRPREAGET